MKHKPGWDINKTPCEEVLLEGKDFLNGNDPYTEPKGNPIKARHWFAMVPQDLLHDGSISMGAKALYGVYHCYAAQKHAPKTFVARERVAAHLGISVQYVSKLKQELVKTGWIEKQHRGQGKSDLITLNEHPFQGEDGPACA
jgi:hypothetical protein